MNRRSFEAEHARAEPITLAGDVLIAVTLALEGAQLRSVRPVAGVLTIAFAISIALARVVLEPARVAGAFGRNKP
jgi:hypothetical protein